MRCSDSRSRALAVCPARAKASKAARSPLPQNHREAMALRRINKVRGALFGTQWHHEISERQNETFSADRQTADGLF